MAPKKRKATKRMKNVRYGYEDNYAFEDELKQGTKQRFNLAPGEEASLKKMKKRQRTTPVEETMAVQGDAIYSAGGVEPLRKGKDGLVELDPRDYQVGGEGVKDKSRKNAYSSITKMKRNPGESLGAFNQRVYETSFQMNQKRAIVQKTEMMEKRKERKRKDAKVQEKVQRKAAAKKEALDMREYEHPLEKARDVVRFGEVAMAPPDLSMLKSGMDALAAKQRAKDKAVEGNALQSEARQRYAEVKRQRRMRMK